MAVLVRKKMGMSDLFDYLYLGKPMPLGRPDMAKSMGDVFIREKYKCCLCGDEFIDSHICFTRRRLGIDEIEHYCLDCAKEERYLEDGSWLPDLVDMYCCVAHESVWAGGYQDNFFSYNIPGNYHWLDWGPSPLDFQTEVCEKCQCEKRFYDAEKWDVDGCTCSLNKGEEKQ